VERGEIGYASAPSTLFVFDGLIARCMRPRMEEAMIGLRRWEAALDQWVFAIDVVDHIAAMINRYEVPIDVVTWHPEPFAELVHERLWSMGAHVRETTSQSFRFMSSHVATDPSVNLVYDPDPAHRMSYGFKARAFQLGQM
jgi:hypothetical protein